MLCICFPWTPLAPTLISVKTCRERPSINVVQRVQMLPRCHKCFLGERGEGANWMGAKGTEETKGEQTWIGIQCCPMKEGINLARVTLRVLRRSWWRFRDTRCMYAIKMQEREFSHQGPWPIAFPYHVAMNIPVQIWDLIFADLVKQDLKSRDIDRPSTYKD